MAASEASELGVFLQGARIGTLSKTRKGAKFAYDASLMDGFAGRPLLSASLPVKARPYSEGLTESWFRGLLPEGERLERLCREIGCDTSDYMEILSVVGWECAGAVSVVANSSLLVEEEREDPLDWGELAERLNALPSFVYGASDSTRVSLGGFQEKLCVVAEGLTCKGGYVTEGFFFLPTAAAMSTHILKPQPRGRFEGLIEAEAWAMMVAGAAARCAKVALLSFDGAPLTLCVERFDRNWKDLLPVRVHQEDCCQALGLKPNRKYASAKEPKGDDPTYVKIADLLMAFSEDPAEEAAELLRQMVANLVLGNVDAHAKNYAFLYKESCLPILSPLYDVAPISQIEPQAIYLSMRIGGKIAAADVQLEDVLMEADSWSVPGLDASKVVQEALGKLRLGIEKANALYPSAGEKFSGAVEERIALLKG